MIGSTSPVVEAELCAAVSDVLRELGFTRLRRAAEPSRAAARDARRRSACPAALHDQALVALDKLRQDRRATASRKELAARGVPDAAAERLLGAFEPLGADGDLARSTRNVCVARASTSARQADGHCRRRHADGDLRLARRPAPRHTCIVDASLARGLSYYTGAIMEIAVAR